jgi:hypothetical protein
MRWISFLAALVASQPLYGQSTPAPVVAVAPKALSTELPSYDLSGTPEEGLFFVAENFPLTQGPAVEEMMFAEAARRCAPKIAFPANYRTMPGNITVKGQTLAGMVRYERIVLCVDPREPIEPAPSDFQASPNDERDLVSTFNTYFDALETGNVDVLMRLRDYPPFPRKVLLQEIGDNGLPHVQQKRTVLKTSWYPNPPELHNGIFGEVLFIQTISETEAICGAAMFYKRAEHDYVFSRLLTVPIEQRPTGTSDNREPGPCDVEPAGAS